MLRIACDIDGVLADFGAGFRRVLAQTSGRALSREADPVTWDWPQADGYTEEEVAAAWYEVGLSATFWKELPARPGAVTFLDQLWRTVSLRNWNRNESVEVYFLTNRPYGVRVKDQTEQWLKDHGFGGLPPTVLIVRGSKGPICKELAITHVVDDRPDNLYHIQSACGFKTRLTLWAAPYNTQAQDDAGARDIAVVQNFDELSKLWSLQ